MRLSFSLGKIFTKATNKNEIFASTNDLYVSLSQIRGKGVFANRPFSKGSVIEVCPILDIPLAFLDQSSELVINYYVFMLDKETGRTVLLLGYGSIYNHASPSSAATTYNAEKNVMVITAVRDIARHEEITINYHGPHDSPEPIDFWEEYK